MATPQAIGASPQRRCIVTGSTHDKADLIRFVVGPDDVVVPDIACKLPGRGMWVKCDHAAVERACAKKLFSASAKKQVTPREDLVMLTQSLLSDRALSALALARKAGNAIHGFEKVSSVLREHKAIALLHASDAGDDGKAKLKTDDSVVTSSQFERDDLSRIMGCENAVHVAIISGPAGQDFLEQLRRFAGFVKETSL